MSYLKDLLIVMQNCRVSEQKARAILDGRDVDIDARDDHDLTWDEIETATGGATGKSNSSCPYCGHPSTFHINRYSLNVAHYHCFYCARDGTARTDDPVDPVKEAAARRAKAKRDADQQAERIAYALQLWDEATSLANIPTARRYFEARAITELPPNLDEVLRWHPACPFGRYGKEPVILALFRDAGTDEPCGIHRTFIVNEREGKSDRMTLGRMTRAAIKLFPLDGDQLFVAEGIENALALSLGSFNGERVCPVWAAGPAGNLAKLSLVPGVRRLIICADNGKAGESNAATCAWRWRAAGREVEIKMPVQAGIDWNDLLKRTKQ
jgi:hypothetical protein